MFFDLWNFLKYQSVFIYLIFDRGILVGKRKFLLINDQRIIVILPTKMMKKTIVLYIRYGRRYIILTIACLFLACLTILKYCDNSILLLFQMRNFYFSTVGFANVNFWRLRRKMKAIDETTTRREKLKKSLLWLTALEKSKFLAKSIDLENHWVVVVTANINLLNELQDVRNLSLIHRNWFTDTS